MSTNQSTLRRSLDLDFSTIKVFTNYLEGGMSRVRGRLGFEEQITGTTATNAVNVTSKHWLDSVIGAFDDNPLAALILENEREARRLDDERFTPIE